MTTEELAAAWIDRFGADAVIEETFGDLAADVPAASWLEALEFARDGLECSYFDWLTGVDELEDGFRVVTHLYSLEGGHHLLIRTLIPRESPVLPSAVGVFRGANWHERETYEMFGIVFEGHPDLKPLLLPDGFEGNPLRKDFVLAARVAKAWPGAKEPGESGGAPSRRKNLPPGVPANWGPAAAEAPKAPERRRPSAAAEARHKPPAAPPPAAPSSAPQESAPAAPASVPHEPTAPVEPPVAGSTETRGKPPADREPATPSPAAPSAAGQGPEAGAEGSAEAGVTSGEVDALDEPQAADGEGGDERA